MVMPKAISLVIALVFMVSFLPPKSSAMNEVADIIHVRDLWTAEWMAPNGTIMHGVTGKGVGVAIIDTGIDGTHPDFEGRVVYNAKYTSETGWVEITDTDTDLGHGTFCAGIAGGAGKGSDGLYKGIAPECNLIGLAAESYTSDYGPVGVWPNFMGAGYAKYAYEWVYNHSDEYNIRVVSCSFGPSGHDEENRTYVLKSVIEKGTAYVYCAGNSGGTGTESKVANLPDVHGIICVGACLKNKTMWDGSSRGNKTNESTWPSLVAPQDRIISTSSKTGVWVNANVVSYPEENLQLLLKGYIRSPTGGTSASTPMVSGVAALIFQVNPNLIPAQAKKIIELSADPIFGPYNETGWFAGHGLVNGTRAVAVAHYMALRPNATVEEALQYYRVVRKEDGQIVLNPLPLPEVPKNETDGSSTQTPIKRFIPGFEVLGLLAATVVATVLVRRKR